MGNDPEVVDSSVSQAIYINGFVFDVFIYQLKGDATWALEVVDELGGSHVWMEEFASDLDALAAAQRTIRAIGPVTFMSDESGPTTP
ncbi:hypothetical protein ROJ8625_00396 [Roseivivax jejudonensis]|uniref:Uncharacterized protein n=1 Tax=Roseivivax jejudonensis TaxID=1529041 RepID=A0A1X6Y889_9RHOB|nr:hypothetical protein [Roseivivax jejudonensis]SLN13345.1 hypothetical protein ROJ8625_00396 [Roseivivax jejudonensis]